MATTPGNATRSWQVSDASRNDQEHSRNPGWTQGRMEWFEDEARSRPYGRNPSTKWLSKSQPEGSCEKGDAWESPEEGSVFPFGIGSAMKFVLPPGANPLLSIL
jgi:hypothetical protein